MRKPNRETHGLSKSSEYRIWQGIKQRCENPTRDAYAYYGGRGIAMCERWQNFSVFYADMGPRPTMQHTIDRIDPNGPYSPDNCRWATRLDQQRNTRRTRCIDGMPVSELEERSVVGRDTILKRMRRGLSLEQAMTLYAHHPDTLTRKTSRFAGVSWDKERQKWLATAKIGGKLKNLGRYSTEIEAAQARQDALERLQA